jgi:ADP-ribose pyrophosphatase YjhB (NUDIX family)
MARLAGSRSADRAHPGELSGPLPQAEFDRIFSRVPRLTVELVITSNDRGVLLALRDLGPCRGLWHLPGGTARFGEPVVEAVGRVARDELGLTVSVGQLLGYIEYPSHYQNGLDSPVGLAFCTTAAGDMPDERDLRSECAWFTVLPDNMHHEQKEFLVRHLDTVSSGPAPER